jgi:uncharacterized protein YjbJ (UPF0337 family)
VVECLTVFSHVGFFRLVLSTTFSNRNLIMGGKTDVAKGRIKEAAGVLTGNDKLRAEGKADQTVGEVKQVADKAVDKVKEAVKKLSN